METKMLIKLGTGLKKAVFAGGGWPRKGGATLYSNVYNIPGTGTYIYRYL